MFNGLDLLVITGTIVVLVKLARILVILLRHYDDNRRDW